MTIGILSDTHGYLHPKIFSFFEKCDEIWHAGDIGNGEILDQLKLIAPVKAVFGNCDDWSVRSLIPEFLIFPCQEHKIALMHIVGSPGKYYPKAIEIIKNEKPTVLVAGHSHILKVMNDSKSNLLFINPGSAGRYGIHNRLTFLRFQINGKIINDLEIYDEPKLRKDDC